MPLQNRVTPSGEIVSDRGRGSLMGNRGCLHRPDRQLGVARWRSKAWICCTLDWRGVRRDPMPPGRWTALFFLDEATALAAGHRPCAYCRRPDFRSFAEAWSRGQGLAGPPRAGDIDGRLHEERVDPATRRKLTRRATFRDLPDGAMVGHEGEPGLVLAGHFLPWSFAGYGPGGPVPAETAVELLTPPATVAAIAAGYRPNMHPTAVHPGFTAAG